MIASLGMYDRPELTAAHDRLWSLIRDRLMDQGMPAPQALTRGEEAYWQAWERPDLVLSQTCGFPYRARLHDKVTLVATPDYGLPDCPPGYYSSVFLSRADDLRTLPEYRTARFAYNEALSQSGWAAPQNHAATMGFHFQPGLATGSHLMSAKAVAEGRAEIAAVDAMTWELLKRYEPWTASLREVARTAPTPGLPYISAAGADAQALQDALSHAIAALPAADRDLLRLRGLVRIASETYRAIPIPPTPEQIARAS